MKEFGKLLLVIIVIEISLGGGGRLFTIGPISPRMVLFGLGMIYSMAILLRREKIPTEFVFLTGAFLALSGISAFVSILKNQSIYAALSDFKPLAYFLLLPFFAITIRKVNDLILIAKLWKLSALILAFSYLAAMAVWKFGLVSTAQMFALLNPDYSPKAEFLFRGDSTFFFKALLYVGVGVFFFIVEKSRNSSGAVLVLLLVIALTMTRGMWLSVFMILSAWAFLYSNNRLKGVALAAGFLLVGVIGVIWINETLPSVTLSNQIRMNDLKGLGEMAWRWQGVLFGQGFGATILGREAIEITYINVLYKQGMVGIVFWLLPARYLFRQMRDIRDVEMRALAMPYFLSAAFVYVVSFTNPFLTNPIGMSVVMIAMVAIRVIRQSGTAGLLESTPRPLALEMGLL